jgi:hypothetical protein
MKMRTARAGAGLAGAAACLALVVGGATHADDEASPSSFGGMVKVLQWDPKTLVGSFKTDKGYFAFQVDELTKVRVDKPVKAGSWQVLNKEAKDIWVLAEKEHYQEPSRTVGRLKPRLVLCAGFAIEPVPEGERRFPKVIGILGWHAATDMDWKKNGVASVGGALFDVGTNPDELIIFGTQGAASDVKKGIEVHVLGPVQGTFPLTPSGKLLTDEEAKETKGTVQQAPLVKAERVVVLHKQFMGVYPLCFQETFMNGATED